MSVVQIILAVAVTAIFVGAVAFVVLYWRFTQWSRTVMGRHLMWFMLVVLAFGAMGIMRYLDLDDWPGADWARAVIYTAGAGVVWQRVFLLWRYQIAHSPEGHDEMCPLCDHPLSAHVTTPATHADVCTIKGCLHGADVELPEEG